MPAAQWIANGLTPFAACVALMSVPRAGLGHKCSPAEELAVTFLQPCIQGETLPEPLGFTSTLTATLAVPRVKQSHIFLRRDGTAVIKLYQDEGFCMHEYEVLDYLHSRNTPTLDISSRVPRAVKVGNSPLLLSISPAGSTDLQRYGRRDCTAQGLGRLRTVLRSVAVTLSMVHTVGVVHCDVNPSNIVVLPSVSRADMQALLIDWENASVKTRSIRPKVSKRTIGFCAIDQHANLNPNTESAAEMWDWESFPYTAVYILCGKHLPWIPDIKMFYGSEAGTRQEEISPEVIAMEKRDFLQNTAATSLPFDCWSDPRSQDLAQSVVSALLAGWRNPDHTAAAVYKSFIAALGDPSLIYSASGVGDDQTQLEIVTTRTERT